MRKLVTAIAGAAALVFSGLTINAAIAQDKKADKGGAPKATIKVLVENDKVRAFETTFAPGAENTAVPSSATRVVRALSGGTLERTYADGKKEKVVYKTGETRINQPSPAYTVKNIGKSEVKLYVVHVK
jgi:predicted regulator of Ras-like GTPase activity (Roadblock/LC7/MglB family)